MDNMYDRINLLCKDRGTNITAVCRELNLARSSLSELNAGRTKSLSAEYLRKIAEYFGVSERYLVTGENEKTPSFDDEIFSDEFIAMYGDAKEILDSEDLEEIKRFLQMKLDIKRERENDKHT